MKAFPGFPTRTPTTPLPDPLFTLLLPQMEDLAEMKVIFYSFWLLARKGRAFLSLGELQADRNLKGVGEEGIAGALDRAVEKGVLLPLNRDGRRFYFLNSPLGQEARSQMEKGVLPSEEKANIFDLYEQNIGLITPIIADQLQEAEALYPTPWIEEGIKLAVQRNKRSWSYISRILERWAAEGKDGEPGRDSEKGADPREFTRGKYGHVYRY
jgi:DNA replication protein